MKTIRKLVLISILLGCLISNYARANPTQVVKPQSTSVYYSTEKGWTFNEIVYIESCDFYSSSSGGTSLGKLAAGNYRFVKSNGSYVALCSVDLSTDTAAKRAYKDKWDEKGGMWSWEQALYNQLDGTAEKDNPTDIKTATIGNKTIQDETQNYRFIKCWIKIEDFKEKTPSYKQTVKYYFREGGAEEYREDTDRRTVTTKKKGKKFTATPATITGYTLEKVTLNGNKKDLTNVSVTVQKKNTVCFYYRSNEMTIKYYPNGGDGSMTKQVMYYGETKALKSNQFTHESGTFLGWSLRKNGTLKYSNKQEISPDLSNQDKSINLYAVWDYAPEIIMGDLYFTKKELISQANMKKYILSYGTVQDKEDGEIKTNTEGATYKTTTNVREKVEAAESGWITYVIVAKDTIGNQVKEEYQFYLVDTTPRKVGFDKRNLRFLEREYMVTLEEDSIWRTEREYLKTLENTWKKDVKQTWIRENGIWRRTDGT